MTVKEKQEATIRIRGLATGYGSGRRKVEVSAPFDADLLSGNLTCLLGPNGSGKSTLLRTLAGFQPPLEGNVELLGRPLSAYSRSELARRIGVVLTERPSLPNMNVEELVALGRSPYADFWGRIEAADRRIVDEAMDLVGISALRARRVVTLSDGERQKAMIAKALAQQTPVIFLDEPTAFLDYPSKVELMLLLRRLAHEQQKTIFLSTHDLELTVQIADLLWLIDKQWGIAIGAPEDLALRGEMERYFARPGVEFNRAEGAFSVQTPIAGEIGVQGDSVEMRLACKGLRRIGLKPVEADATGSQVLTYNADAWHYAGAKYSSIEALLRALSR